MNIINMGDKVDVHIEISKGSNIKYEYDHNNNQLRCDRILRTTKNTN